MIIKPFELKKVNFQNSLLNLVYGDNQGYKEQIINDYFLKNFKGDVSRYEENDILNNSEIFISNLLNKSLFENEKIIIITRVTEKILNIFIEIYERQISGTKIIINANFLEKKSKLRNFFEKKKEIICVPVYEDDNKSLNELVLNFFKNKNKKFSQEIINLLIVRAKGDRKNLQNELLKIENLSLSKKNIEIEDVMKLTNLAENFSVFELSDNYLAKNSRKVSHILNENNYNSDDCILIIRTIISKSTTLLKLKKEIDKNNNVDLVLSSFKPPIFWKEKEIVKKQAQSWSTKEVKRIIYKLNDLELIVKKNSMNSLNFVSDFVRNY